MKKNKLLTSFFLIFFCWHVNAQNPTITTFTPVNARVGSLVTINGTNLSSSTNIVIGGVAAINIKANGNSVVALVMPGSQSGTIAVDNGGVAFNSTNAITIIASTLPNKQQRDNLVFGGLSGRVNIFSLALSADGNTAVVGSKAENFTQGAAWIFVRSRNSWKMQGNRLVGTGGFNNSEQGSSVDISADGNTVVIGAANDNSGRGAAWVFVRNSITWTQQGNKLVGTSGSTNANQGSSVSISANGNTILIGGYNDNNGQGATWVFTRTGTLWSQQGNKLVGTGGSTNANQGKSVSISADGNTAIIGGPNDNNDQGAAWIFTRSGSNWSQQGNKLVGSNSIGNAIQGASVDISADGNTAIIGGYFDDSSNGAAWIFTRSGSNWSQQGNKLLGTGNSGAAYQGVSVGISADGNTAIIGGYGDNSFNGAAWLFSRNGATWAQQGSKLIGSGTTNSSRQGLCVSISADGNTAILGGINNRFDSVVTSVFTAPIPEINVEGNTLPFNTCVNNPSLGQSFLIWGQFLTSILSITAPQGYEISFSGDNGFSNSLTLVPSNGVVELTYIYIRLSSSSSGNFVGNINCNSSGVNSINVPVAGKVLAATPTINSFSPLNGTIGTMVTIKGTNLSSTTAVNIGSTPSNILQANDTILTIIVMPGTTSNLINIVACGSVSTTNNFNITTSSSSYSQQGSKLMASSGSYNGYFGNSSALSADGNTAIIGVNEFNNREGGAYIFVRTGNNWVQQGNRLLGTDASTNARQGYAVAISGDGNTAVMSGPWDDNEKGAIWIFKREGDLWTQQGAKLVGNDAVGNGHFGTTVGISGDGNTIVVGSMGDDYAKGAAFVFVRNGNIWRQQGAKLAHSFVYASNIGNVAISADGNTIVTSSALDSVYTNNAGSGILCFYKRNGNIWNQQGSLVRRTDTTSGSYFGLTIAISADGSTVVAGSSNYAHGRGAAWVFNRIGNSWVQQGAKLEPSDANTTNQVRWNVGISADGNKIIVGGSTDNSITGAAWVFTRNNNTWNQSGSKIVGFAKSGFNSGQGFSVAISGDGNTLISGAPYDNGSNGSVWVFVNYPAIGVTNNLSNFNSCSGLASAQQSLVFNGGNLVNNVTVTASLGFEISTTSGSGFSNSINFTPNLGKLDNSTLFVRVAANATANPAGSIEFRSNGQLMQSVAVTGIISSKPTLNIGTIPNVSTSATSFNIPYSNVTGSPNRFNLLTALPNPLPSFSSILNRSIVANPLVISIPPTNLGLYNFNLIATNSSTGCVSDTIPLTLLINVLPLKLFEFKATKKEKNVVLNWITENEINTNFTNVEFSNNGLEWEIIGKVMNNNYYGKNEYSFTHKLINNNLLVSKLYYRLKQVDLNDKYSYSEIRQIANDNFQTTIKIYPNPVFNGKLNIDFGDEIKTKTNYIIATLDGKIVKEGFINFRVQTIDVPSLKKGIYVLKFDKKQTLFTIE
jgi:hypothetical protein